jgi:hypothetical protein
VKDQSRLVGRAPRLAITGRQGKKQSRDKDDFNRPLSPDRLKPERK